MRGRGHSFPPSTEPLHAWSPKTAHPKRARGYRDATAAAAALRRGGCREAATRPPHSPPPGAAPRGGGGACALGCDSRPMSRWWRWPQRTRSHRCGDRAETCRNARTSCSPSAPQTRKCTCTASSVSTAAGTPRWRPSGRPSVAVATRHWSRPGSCPRTAWRRNGRPWSWCGAWYARCHVRGAARRCVGNFTRLLASHICDGKQSELRDGAPTVARMTTRAGAIDQR